MQIHGQSPELQASSNTAEQNTQDGNCADKIKVQQINATTLAYLGDSVYEVYIREHLINSGNYKVDKLHKVATKYVSAKAQSMIITKLRASEFLTEEEESVYKRGRNRHTNTLPKNTSPMTYKEATGFESLIGYLYMVGQNDRLAEIINKAIEIVG